MLVTRFCPHFPFRVFGLLDERRDKLPGRRAPIPGPRVVPTRSAWPIRAHGTNPTHLSRFARGHPPVLPPPDRRDAPGLAPIFQPPMLTLRLFGSNPNSMIVPFVLHRTSARRPSRRPACGLVSTKGAAYDSPGQTPREQKPPDNPKPCQGGLIPHLGLGVAAPRSAAVLVGLTRGQAALTENHQPSPAYHRAALAFPNVPPVPGA